MDWIVLGTTFSGAQYLIIWVFRVQSFAEIVNNLKDYLSYKLFFAIK